MRDDERHSSESKGSVASLASNVPVGSSLKWKKHFAFQALYYNIRRPTFFQTTNNTPKPYNKVYNVVIKPQMLWTGCVARMGFDEEYKFVGELENRGRI